MKHIFHWKYIFFKQLYDFTVTAGVKQFFKFIFGIISVCPSFYKELAKSNGNEIVIRYIFNLNFFLRTVCKLEKLKKGKRGQTND